METKSVDVYVSAWSHPSSEFLSEVLISKDREFEELIIDENDDSVTSFRFYPDSSTPDPLIYLEFQSFEPNYIYQLIHTQLHDHVLSKQISDQIVVKAQRLRRSDQSSDLPPQQPLLMVVSIKLTQKVYIVVPCYSAPSATYLDKESEEEEETETCAICLECILDEDKRIYHMRNCSHLFHEECVIEWLNRQHNSCPLCRQPGYQVTRV